MTAPVPVPDVAALCDHLEQLRAAATDGPWTVGHGGEIDAGRYDTVIGRGDVDCMSYCYGGTSTIEGDNLDADAALIVALVNATPTLIAAARERDRLRDAVAGLADHWDTDEDARYAHNRVARSVAARSLRAVLSEALPGGEKS